MARRRSQFGFGGVGRIPAGGMFGGQYPADVGGFERALRA
jgi:hypothetical protein